MDLESPASGSVSLERTLIRTLGPSSETFAVSFTAVGPSLTPLIVTVTVAVDVTFALSFIVYVNVSVAEVPAFKLL